MTNQQKKNVRKWIEALRSGEFSQTTAMLFNEGTGGHCCLGVARCVFKNTPYRVYEAKAGSVNEGLLTDSSFEKTFGLNADTQQFLANLNDNEYSFDDIANELEELIN